MLVFKIYRISMRNYWILHSPQENFEKNDSMEILHTEQILTNVLDVSFTNVTYSGINRSTTYDSFTLLFCLRMDIKRGSQGLNRMGRLSPRQPPANY